MRNTKHSVLFGLYCLYFALGSFVCVTWLLIYNFNTRSRYLVDPILETIYNSLSISVSDCLFLSHTLALCLRLSLSVSYSRVMSQIVSFCLILSRYVIDIALFQKGVVYHVLLLRIFVKIYLPRPMLKRSFCLILSRYVSDCLFLSHTLALCLRLSLSVSYSRVMSQIVSFHLLFLFIWIINIGTIYNSLSISVSDCLFLSHTLALCLRLSLFTSYSYLFGLLILALF
jgi:hypothetical protein